MTCSAQYNPCGKLPATESLRASAACKVVPLPRCRRLERAAGDRLDPAGLSALPLPALVRDGVLHPQVPQDDLQRAVQTLGAALRQALLLDPAGGCPGSLGRELPHGIALQAGSVGITAATKIGQHVHADPASSSQLTGIEQPDVAACGRLWQWCSSELPCLLQGALYTVLSDVAGVGADTQPSSCSTAAPGSAPQAAPAQQSHQSGGQQQLEMLEEEEKASPSGCCALPTRPRSSRGGEQQQASNSGGIGQGQEPRPAISVEVLNSHLLVPAAEQGQRAQLVRFSQYILCGTVLQVQTGCMFLVREGSALVCRACIAAWSMSALRTCYTLYAFAVRVWSCVAESDRPAGVSTEGVACHVWPCCLRFCVCCQMRHSRWLKNGSYMADREESHRSRSKTIFAETAVSLPASTNMVSALQRLMRSTSLSSSGSESADPKTGARLSRTVSDTSTEYGSLPSRGER